MKPLNRNASRALRISPELIETILNQLDARESQRGSNRRRSVRYKYRAQSVVVEFPANDGHVQYVVPTRDLSRDGVSFLMGHYVYPGTPCRVRLVSEYNIRRDVQGAVVRCAYVAGTAGLHEVGVHFESPIDVALFHRAASSAKVMILDDESASRELLSELFRRLNVEVHVETDAAAALDRALKDPLDLLLVNYDAATFKACELIRELRKRGYFRPIFSLTSREGRGAEPCQPGGKCTDCQLVPLTRESLQLLVGRVRAEPVVSSAGHDPSMTATINAFVAGLQTQSRAIENALAADDRAALTQRLQRLAALASAAGFDVLTAKVRHLLELVERPAAPHELRDQVGELSIACGAARPATLSPTPEPGHGLT